MKISTLSDIAARVLPTVAREPMVLTAGSSRSAMRAMPAELFGVRLRQSTEQTCGAMSLFMATLEVLPGYRESFRSLAANRSELAQAIAHSESSMYQRARRSALGLFSWPAAFGTPPWGLARELTKLWNANHESAVQYRSIPVPSDPEVVRGVLMWAYHANRHGLPVALYTGNDLESGVVNAVPRHVVLAMPQVAEAPSVTQGNSQAEPLLRIYDPASGFIYPLAIESLIEGTQAFAALGNWKRVVWALLPEPQR